MTGFYVIGIVIFRDTSHESKTRQTTFLMKSKILG